MQRRLIEYWKLRSEQHSDYNDMVRERLTNAFRSANEEVAYLMQFVEKSNGMQQYEMFKAFEAKGDMIGAYQFWKPRFNRGDIEN